MIVQGNFLSEPPEAPSLTDILTCISYNNNILLHHQNIIIKIRKLTFNTSCICSLDPIQFLPNVPVMNFIAISSESHNAFS